MSPFSWEVEEEGSEVDSHPHTQQKCRPVWSCEGCKGDKDRNKDRETDDNKFYRVHYFNSDIFKTNLDRS